MKNKKNYKKITYKNRELAAYVLALKMGWVGISTHNAINTHTKRTERAYIGTCVNVCGRVWAFLWVFACVRVCSGVLWRKM